MTSASEVVDRGLALGFDRVGIARAEPLSPEGERLRAWIASGKHGQMAWMAENVDVRCDPTQPGMLDGAASVVVCALAFARPSDVVPKTRIARYARGHEYHNVVRKKARRLAAWLRSMGHRARPLVDDAPVFERAWAQRAGIGFVGKNCMLIVPGLGSHVFLAEVVTDAALEPTEPASERCGSCRLCLDACPTSAFDSAWQLDARRCVSYATIEHRGPIADEIRPGIGDHLFGCDDCQDVCPFNKTSIADLQRSNAFAPDPRWNAPPESLLGLTEEQFLQLTLGSSVRRATRESLVRNACIVLGNTGNRDHVPALRRTAETDDSPVVREAAQWAITRLEKG
ncbi:MAG: tRNA epoxyqueuosine(34) reductase QueG [Deltaproteobacteria bacterium]|nr:tRNA epoxyqueuosine(34) reductase QueG [Deltaproteobacteria bacterium]